MSFDPGATQVAVDEGADRLEKAADQLYDATIRFERAEEEWERLALIEKATIALDTDQYGKTSDDTRWGIVLKRFQDAPVYLEYVAAKAEMAALTNRYRALSAAVSARQSLLKARGG